MSALGECGDAGLVQLAQSGDGEAFAELYRRHYPAVVATCARRRAGDAEEVAQAAFMRAFERIHRCQGEARFGAWIQVIARHVAVDVARARSRDLARPLVAVQPESVGDWPEEHALRQERVETLRSVMGRLPRRQREVLYARDVEGRRPPEIAAALGLSLAAVDSLLLRARRAAAAGYRTMAAESGIAQTASTAAVVVAGGGVVSGPGRLVRAVTRGFDVAIGAMSKLGNHAGMPTGFELLVGAAAVVALAGPATEIASPGAASPTARPAAIPGSTYPGAVPVDPAEGLSDVREPSLEAPSTPSPPATPGPPATGVPEAPVSPPPAGPNPLGQVLSAVDVEARVTGISMPQVPEGPRTGLAPVDQSRPGPVPDRPGRRAWDAGRQRGEALWSDGRRDGHETWDWLRHR